MARPVARPTTESLMRQLRPRYQRAYPGQPDEAETRALAHAWLLQLSHHRHPPRRSWSLARALLSLILVFRHSLERTRMSAHPKHDPTYAQGLHDDVRAATSIQDSIAALVTGTAKNLAKFKGCICDLLTRRGVSAEIVAEVSAIADHEIQVYRERGGAELPGAAVANTPQA